jgi:citrate synthase
VAALVLGAQCAFASPIHGGDPGPTLDLLEALAATDDMDAWIERKLHAGERLMGVGRRCIVATIRGWRRCGPR